MEDTVADYPVEIAAHHQEETDIQTVQADTAHTASVDKDKAPHHITSTLLQLQSPVQPQTVTQKINQYNLKSAKTDVQHLYQENSSHSPHTATQKTQIQHVMNYQYQTHHQKQSQTPVTDYYQRTPILIQIFYRFKTIPDALQDHLPTLTQKLQQRSFIHQNTSVRSIELHKHSNTTMEEEQLHLDNTSEDEITPVPTDTEQTATAPPSRTHPIPLPRPSKVTNAKETSANNQLKYTQTQSQLGKHHYYLHRQCQLNNTGQEHSFQDHHNATATNTSIIHTFQDHRMYQSVRDNDHHYYHYHHIRYQHFQDHTHPHKDTSYHKYLHTYQFYYYIQVNLSPHYNIMLQKDQKVRLTTGET